MPLDTNNPAHITHDFSYQVQVSGGAILSFKGNFLSTQTTADKHAVLDEVVALGERQRAKAVVPELEAALRQTEATIVATESDYAELLKGHDPGAKGPAQAQYVQAKQQAERNLEAHKHNLADLKKQIAEAKEKIG